ncbi:glycosyltransferase family 2 protein, partial [Aliivibrio kagoshimensis]|uniref:glycosyltransferase family 2 protein n=1 Tax=Aliivibrio kagoshimensis TaxID=2910230 RepID=UPI003D13EEB9
MEIKNEQPYFSVIIPTRDRPELFFRTLDSVLQQTSENFEIIVVNDGSDDDNLTVYQERLSEVVKLVSFISLVHTPNGHGPSYSRNFGARIAKGQYLCFLDDDDEWTDPEYLGRVYSEIQGQENRVDAYYCHQKAYLTNGEQKTETIWIEDLIEDAELGADSIAKPVSVNYMLKSNGFAHMNCSIYRKPFFNDVIQGMNENIRYESDRDLYYR